MDESDLVEINEELEEIVDEAIRLNSQKSEVSIKKRRIKQTKN